ncbi:hypothetical protein B0F90DRAFT_1814841 [Multifurca ochricompacta]|uniref:Uncharacterized protein n=1 Tax=Multifurca ochricompacta TaxID=376703 RepID=A0AAD4MBH3_9AGAM|nr:hypothetical protein B0F90DRAFT_1814841 [Multifurca ochricompacta]
MEYSSAEHIERSDLDKHEFAQYILQEHGTHFPKFADMSVFVESIPDLKQRINQLQTQHAAELEKVYARQAAQYLDDALDRYMAQDDEAANGSYSGIINELYGQPRRERTNLEAKFERETTLVRLGHIDAVAPLLYKLANKQREEEKTRKRREAQFPPSVAEFYTIQDKELQQRVARFLASDAVVQDKMLNEYGWAWRQVQGLKEAYSKDTSFKDDIQRRVTVVRDPRRKPTLT